MQEIYRVQRQEIELFNKRAEIAFYNNFALTADITGIERYERILKIIPSPSTEDLEFRRGRVINRLALGPPFTEIFLRQRLESIFGKENVQLVVDHDIYTVYFSVETEIYELYRDTVYEIRQLIPADLIIITMNRIGQEVKPAQTVACSYILTRLTINYTPVQR